MTTIDKIGENILFSTPTFQRQRDYWQRKLSSGLEKTNLLFAGKRGPAQENLQAERDTVDFVLPGTLCRKIIQLSKDSHLSIYIILLAALKSLIYRYNCTYPSEAGNTRENREYLDITVISPVYKPDISEKTLNTYLFIRDALHEEMTFKELLLEVRQSVLEAYDHQDYPLDRVVQDSSLTRIICLLENIHISLQDGLMGEEANDKLIFSFVGNIGAIKGKILFQPHYYERYYITQITGHLLNLLEDSLADLNRRISRVSYLSPGEKRRLIDEFNHTETRCPGDKTLHRLFAEQAKKNPHHIAVIGVGLGQGTRFLEPDTPKGNIHLTYSRLDNASHRLAHRLEETGVQPGTIVGIRVERSVQMIIGLLAILKAGAAYLPITLDYPEERVDYLLKDSGVKILLTRQELAGAPGPEAFKTSPRDTAAPLPLSPWVNAPAASLAYIIYTSGTTGKPKGVAVEHRQAVNIVTWFGRRYRLQYGTHVLQLAEITFDASVNQVFGTLLHGAALQLTPGQLLLDMEALRRYINNHRIHVIYWVPLLLNELLGDREKLQSLQIVISGAERLDETVKNRILKPGYDLYNQYGPTETTVDALSSKCGTGPVTLGQPVANARCYIFDRWDNLLPVGPIGELMVSGAGVARGYINRPELTLEKFTENPFVPGQRLYRTGDLAQWLPNGDILFSGRMDHQVKIRGYRVELGEIENYLLTHPKIKEAVVAVEVKENKQGGENKSLTAYIVPLSTGDFDQTQSFAREMRDNLSGRLPFYMVPSRFVPVKKLPRTPNGKVDLNALRQTGKPLDNRTPYAPPGNNLEKIIAALWKETLGVEHIGATDNFFDLGGNSLSILQVNRKLQETLRKEIPVIKLFRYPTVSTLAAYLSSVGEGDGISLPGSSQSQNRRDRAGSGWDTAVIGMAGRFPGAGKIREYWELLKNGSETIAFYNHEELAQTGIEAEMLKDPGFVKASGVLENKGFFDAAFFGYIPMEAEIMDPQIRVFHEVVWEALESSGYEPGTYSGRIGLYAGASNSFAWEATAYLSQRHKNLASMEVSQLSDKDLLCCRISYKLNLKGPAVSVQSKCSTSLLAIHLACRGLQVGDCDIALAGGISLSPSRGAGYLYREGMINSPDGHCRAFDAKADGTVGGDGAGVVVLKPLPSATAHGDTILALIKGSAANNDGIRKVGFTAPSVQGQAEVIRAALETAGVESRSIGYIETHGTGTRLGDPIEIEALNLAFNSNKKNSIPLGSVKTNFGHLDAAAGAAGFIKTVLALKHRQVPPTLHFNTPNPAVDFNNGPFYVNTTLTQWRPAHDDEGKAYPLRAGVSSFGIGGTNVHLVLEEAPPPVIGPSSSVMGEGRDYQLIVLSAKTPNALDQMTANLVDFFKENPVNPGPGLAGAAYTLQVGRKAFAHRKITVCASGEEVIAALSTPGSEKVLTHILKHENPQVVMMFPGQGAQYVNMGRELYRDETVFREEMDRCFEVLAGLLEYDIKEILYPFHRSNRSYTSNNSYKSNINQTEVAQPLLFCFEYALAKLLMKWGIEPGAMIGHSIGEYVAACLSGVFSLADALKLVVLRGKAMQQMPAGAMLGVSLPEDRLKPLLEHRDLSLAAVNSSSLCVVSGAPEAVSAFERQLLDSGHKSQRLHTSHAFHSRMMDPILAEFQEEVRKIKLNKPLIPYISNLTGQWSGGPEAVDPRYWPAQIRQTVQFSGGLAELLKQSKAIFIEVGPGKALSTFVRQHRAKTDNHQVVNLVRHPQENCHDRVYLLNRLGQLWLYGIVPRWEAYYHGETRQRVPLPTYPFESQLYWPGNDPLHLLARKEAAPAETLEKSVLRKKPDLADWFYVPSWELAPASPGQETPGPLFTLIFADEHGLGNQLAEKLRTRAHQDGHRVVIVQKGKKFTAPGELTYTLNPANKDDYIKLVEELQQTDCMPRQVIHCWNVTSTSLSRGDEELPVNTVNDSLTTGFYSLVYLAGALNGKGGNSEIIRFYVLVNRMVEVIGGEELSPEKAVLLGPCRIIPQEFPRFRCTAIDICFPHSSRAKETEILEQLYAEIFLQARGVEGVIAYRGKRRWVQSFKPVPLEKNSGVVPYLREQGVYLITGAPGDYGSIGFILARYLARQTNARLVLLGRTQFPPKDRWNRWLARHDNSEKDSHTGRIARKIRLIQELEHLGAEVLTLSADVSDEKQLRAAVSLAENRFGKINGVIHAAAVMGNRLLAFMVDDEDNDSQYQAQFIPKIYGLLTLYRVFKDKGLDFCLLSSSLGAVMGPLVAYTAACNFMDAFAHWVNRQEPNGWVSVNWDNWYPLEDSESAENKADSSELFITPAEGVDAFHRILAWGSQSQVLTSTGDLGPRLAQVPGKTGSINYPLAERDPDISRWFYKPAWKNSPLSIPSLTLDKNGIDASLPGWLVFTGNTGLAAGVVERLRNAGHQVVTVEMGTEFVRRHSRGFTLHPAEADHYSLLFRELEESRQVPRRILHCWNLTEPGEQGALDIGLHSLIFIARALGSLREPLPAVQLAVVSRNLQPVTGKEKLSPGKAALLGPLKIIPFEYDNITCRGIDIDNPGADTIIDHLLGEFATDFTRQPVIAYRDNHRLEQYFEPVKLGPVQGTGPRLKEKGVYLVTGGLGGMGFVIAQHLAQHLKAALILTDLQDFPGREQWDRWLAPGHPGLNTETGKRIQQILELEKQGARFMVRQADVSDYERMQAVISEARQRFGTINGILHTAGLIDYAGVVQRRTRQGTEELLAAKVKGTLVLDRIFHDQPLDFLVLFSSAGNILYGLKFGQVGYNAGHEFLDVYAHHKQKQGTFTVTIDWNDWLEVGMSVRAAGKLTGGKRETSMAEEIFSISPSEGLAVLKRILANPYPQIAVSTHDLARLMQRINNPRENVMRLFESSTGAAGSRSPGQRPELGTAYVAPGKQTEKILAQIWQDFFNIEPIGLNDDFFELGGDSLKAMTIIGLIHHKLNLKISLAEFFKQPNLKGLCRFLEETPPEQYTALPRALEKEYYPLSSAQKRIYIIQQVQPEGIVFNESSAMEIQGEPDREKLEDTFKQLIQRHESLRTSFQLKDEEPVQRIHQEVEFKIEYYDLKTNPKSQIPNPKLQITNKEVSPQGRELSAGNCIKHFIRPFDLSRAPLLRVGLVTLAERHFILIIDTHHIISDGTSMGIFINEFMAIYAGEILLPLTVTYKDYSEWQNSQSGQETMARQETYWLRQFQGALPRLNLPIDYPRPSIRHFQGNTRRFEIGAGLSAALKKLALKEETSLFMVMFAIFNLLLWRLSQQEQILCGTPAAGRSHTELQQVIGMFVNTLALKVRIKPGKTFKEFLARVTRQVLQAFENQDYQFEDLVDQVETQRDAGRNPVFDVMFELHNVADQDFILPGLSIKPYGSENPVSRFDLTLKVFQWEEIFSFSLTYSTALFKEETIAMFIDYFIKLLEGIPAALEKRLSEIEVLSQTAKAEVLADATADLENE